MQSRCKRSKFHHWSPRGTEIPPLDDGAGLGGGVSLASAFLCARLCALTLGALGGEAGLEHLHW